MKNFRVFTRNWWQENSAWPNGLEPDGSGKKTTIGFARSEQEAREVAQDWNKTHDPGRLSNKAEFESIKY